MQSLITCLYCSTDLAEFTIGSWLDKNFIFVFVTISFSFENLFQNLEQTALWQHILQLDVVLFTSLPFIGIVITVLILDTFTIQLPFTLNISQSKNCINCTTNKKGSIKLSWNNLWPAIKGFQRKTRKVIKSLNQCHYCRDQHVVHFCMMYVRFISFSFEKTKT